MAVYLLKFGAAALIMPLITLLFGRALNITMVLIFWPASIGLLSLGSEEKPLQDVICVWVVAAGLNVVLYLVIGMVIHALRTTIKSLRK